MLGQSGRLILCAAMLLGAAALGLAEEFGTGPVPEQGIAVLRNGELIEGKISRVGGFYQVAVPGGEIRLKDTEVEFCCRNLDEGYRLKRASVPPGEVEAHLRLAQWCLRHGLLGPAGMELADALAADPTHPAIALLERRLKAAVEPLPPRSAAEPASQTQTVSPEELDRMVRGLPPGSVETFTQTIQPLLVNHCGSAECHGPQTNSEFQLFRLPSDRPPTRRLTQRNLSAVLPWIDRQDPAASPLLGAATRPHGGATVPVFMTAQADQYQRIVDWVWLLSDSPAAEVPGSATPAEQPSVRAMAAESPGPASLPAELAATSDPPPAAVPDPPPGPSAEGPAVGRGGLVPVFVPADPFDPEIFNRRYFGRSERED